MLLKTAVDFPELHCCDLVHKQGPSEFERSEEEAPTFIRTLSPTEVGEGERLSLSCAFSGKPDPNVEWFLDGQLLTGTDTISIKTRSSSSRLEISPTDAEDAGDYVCKATNTAGVASTKANVTVRGVASTKANVTVRAAKRAAPKEKAVQPPQFLEQFQGQSVVDGDRVTIQCRISGKPDVSWTVNGKPVKDSDDFKYQNAGDVFKLIVGEIYPEDSGVYTCTAANAAGTATTSATIFVKVPDEEPSDPVFVSWPLSQNCDEGSPVTLSCCLDSPAALTVSWSKDGRSVGDSSRLQFSQDGSTHSLTIPAALSTDSGTYCVTAKSSQGSSAWACTLAVTMGDSTTDMAKVQALLKSVEVLP
ncbi:hypothetical protein ACOMHN_010761 [Nucella lapillus]